MLKKPPPPYLQCCPAAPQPALWGPGGRWHQAAERWPGPWGGQPGLDDHGCW